MTQTTLEAANGKACGGREGGREGLPQAANGKACAPEYVQTIATCTYMYLPHVHVALPRLL